MGVIEPKTSRITAKIICNLIDRVNNLDDKLKSLEHRIEYSEIRIKHLEQL